MGLEDLGKWPLPGEEARRKPVRMTVVTDDKALRVIHGKEHRIPITFYVSNDLIHLGKIAVPPHVFSEPESHKGDELVYALEGTLIIYLPKTIQSFEVREGEAFFVPEGVEHEYHNFTDKVIKAIFIIAPQL
jgi:mannose-6-phosphate isomerase-like protein (cupin superfamily)